MRSTSLSPVATHLVRQAQKQPDQAALYVPLRPVRTSGPTPHRTVTYRELNADSDAIAHGLQTLGLGRGRRVAVLVPPSVDFFAVTFALLKAAAVPVFIDPGMGVRGLGRCLDEAEPEGFIGVARAHWVRRLLGWGRRSIRLTVGVGRWCWRCDTHLADLRRLGSGRGTFPLPEVQPEETAAILFTSGSTGPAKGAVYTHAIFAAQIEAIRAVYGITPGEIDYCTFPLFALFGPALGMSCIIPDMDASRPGRIRPERAVAQMRQFGATNMFGSPAVIDRLGQWAAAEHARRVPAATALNSQRPPAATFPDDSPQDEQRNYLRQNDLRQSPPLLPTLRRVISAGAPAVPEALERFTTLLPPEVDIFTPYGATEALPVANIGSREILNDTRYGTAAGRGVCVGRPVPGVQVHIIPVTDDPIPQWRDDLEVPPGTVGEIVVRGPVVTSRYHRRPEATALAKIFDPQRNQILHRMGDVGYWDEQGRLWYCGRKSQRVVTPQGTLFPEMVERVFYGLDGVRRTALVGVRRGDTVYAVLCVEWDRRVPWPQVEAALRQRASEYPHTAWLVAFLPYARPFPVDRRHNAKIFREQLADWADRILRRRRWRPQLLLAPLPPATPQVCATQQLPTPVTLPPIPQTRSDEQAVSPLSPQEGPR